MIQIRVTESGHEIFSRILSEGRYHLGRSDDNEIAIDNRSISRQHLRIDVTPDQVAVTDLGSTNGSWLEGQQLTPHHMVTWPVGLSLQIGALSLWLETVAPVDRQTGRENGVEELPDRVKAPASPTDVVIDDIFNSQYTILGNDAKPQLTELGKQPILIGSGPDCNIRLSGPNIASRQILVQLNSGHVEVTNLDLNTPVYLGDQPLVIGRSTRWHPQDALKVGNSVLHLSQSAIGRAPTKGAVTAPESGQPYRRYFGLAALVGLAIICLLGIVVVGLRGVSCGKLDPACLLTGSGHPGDGNLLAVIGDATPTLAPFATNAVSPTSIPTVIFNPDEPTPTSIPVDCAPESSSQVGWLDLPFPYQGTNPIFGGSAEDFRRISQRSRFGGRINSFFDHEFPVYPAIFGGREPDSLDNTLVVFNGVRSEDAYSQDTEDADWYSGHSGIDFAPANPREATTPILAAADGRLALAKIDKDGNHMVWLEHDPDGDGRFQYTTLYFHLDPDPYFFAMTEMEERTPIQAGQRLGTMGTTGRSSGIHLHFEVRHDIDRDGRFSMFERVDPYGWFPSQEIADDPWAKFAEWIDVKGDTYEHEGIESQYLWVHPLVEVVDSAGECQQVTNIKVDLYNVLGWAVVDPGFTYIARNEQGEILETGQPHRRTITILEEDLDGVDRDTISLEWLNPKLDTWFTHSRAELEPNASGGYTFSAIVDKTGRYVLVAKEVVDRVPPATSIRLAGERTGDDNTYRDPVLVTLVPMDRGLIQSEIAKTQYSIDCGQSWTTYSEPFEVSLATDHSCGDTDAASETIELGENDFLLLAISEDAENNVEQPPAQVRFRLE